MLGAVFGDIIGSTYEWHNVKRQDFELFPPGSRFTDDTVLSAAVADKLLNAESSGVPSRTAYAMWYKQYYKRYPDAGFGQMFRAWAKEDVTKIQRSYGNGAAMRISAVGYAFDSVEKIKREVNASCYYTHNHPEAKKGALAIAMAVYLARKQQDKDEIRRYMEKKFKYHFQSLDEIRDAYVFDSRTSYSVPPAMEAFFESDSYEDAIRKAVSIGGDSDTIACMAGGIAQAYYCHIPGEICNKGMMLLDSGLKNVIMQFCERYGVEW